MRIKAGWIMPIIVLCLAGEPRLFAQSEAGAKAEVSGNVGLLTLSGLDDELHFSFGGQAAYNQSDRTQVFGEFRYLPIGDGASGQHVGGGVRYHFKKAEEKVRPFVVMAGGLHRESGFGTTINGTYVGGGGGVSVFMSKKWGIRPEARYNWLIGPKVGGQSTSGAYLEFTCGVFFRF